MRFLWYALLTAILAATAAFWAWNHVNSPVGNILTGDATGQMLAYGRLAGLLAALGALFQIVLIGRIRPVERAFGLDRLSRLHHVAGFAMIGCILAHPVLVTFGRMGWESTGFLAQFVDLQRTEEDVFAATIGVVIIVAALVFSVFILIRKMRYEAWYATHLSLYIAVALAFGHQTAAGQDFVTNQWFRWYWLALYVTVAAALLWYRFLTPLLAFSRHRFRVEQLVAEAGDVTSVHIGGWELERFRIRPGQFVIVRFLAKGFRWEAHPFTVSAPADGRHIRLSIKRLGDFTRRIPALAPGTPVIIDGPHGRFTAERCARQKVLLVAGGIGITPLRAMLDGLLAAGREVVLLYGNRSRSGIVFEQELAALSAAHPSLKVVHVLSDDSAWSGEKGHIDRERIARLVPDVQERDVFLCGPPIMMKLVRKALAALGVPGSRVHYERFAL